MVVTQLTSSSRGQVADFGEQGSSPAGRDISRLRSHRGIERLGPLWERILRSLSSMATLEAYHIVDRYRFINASPTRNSTDNELELVQKAPIPAGHNRGECHDEAIVKLFGIILPYSAFPMNPHWLKDTISLRQDQVMGTLR